MEVLKIKGINKNFEDIKVLHDINLTIKKGEFISIVGPSGCGKSTLFNIITNLIDEYEGSVLIDGKSAKNYEKAIAYMPQKDLLLPWRTLYDNAKLPLEIAKMNPSIMNEKISPLLKEFNLKGFENSYPNELSGGMKQRGALLRTFLIDSKIMLLDEPFGALDAITRMELQEWLLEIWEKHKHSVLFITHDIDEALFLSDKVYVMSKRPGKFVLELEIDAKRPRNREDFISERYLKDKLEILKILKGN